MYVCSNFQNFDNTQPSVPPNYDAGYSSPNQNQGLGGFYDPTAYTDSSFATDKSKPGVGASTGNEFEDEPPLLEGRHDQRLNYIFRLSNCCLSFCRTGHQSESYIPEGKFAPVL